MNETRYPLCWPADWKRTTSRTSAQFSKGQNKWHEGRLIESKKRLSISDAIDRIADELNRFGVKEETVIISTNLPITIQGTPRGDRGEPSDPGVAVYWKRNGKSQCMAIDRYTRVADNLAAVAATLEALRAIERHGGGTILERAFIGFAALPAAKKHWGEIFGYKPGEIASADDIQRRFRALAQQLHPDKSSGDHTQMAELNAARDEALKEIA